MQLERGKTRPKRGGKGVKQNGPPPHRVVPDVSSGRPPIVGRKTGETARRRAQWGDDETMNRSLERSLDHPGGKTMQVLDDLGLLPEDGLNSLMQLLGPTGDWPRLGEYDLEQEAENGGIEGPPGGELRDAEWKDGYWPPEALNAERVPEELGPYKGRVRGARLGGGSRPDFPLNYPAPTDRYRVGVNGEIQPRVPSGDQLNAERIRGTDPRVRDVTDRIGRGNLPNDVDVERLRRLILENRDIGLDDNLLDLAPHGRVRSTIDSDNAREAAGGTPSDQEVNDAFGEWLRQQTGENMIGADLLSYHPALDPRTWFEGTEGGPTPQQGLMTSLMDLLPVALRFAL